MPRLPKVPEVGTPVLFRLNGDKHLHEGTYTENGFKKCDGFVCYTTCDVDYWRPKTDARQELMHEPLTVRDEQ